MRGENYLKRDDRVEVIAGRDKGRVGKILRVLPDRDRAVVERINVVKRHTKPSMANQQGGIIEKEAPIHVSNLMLICPKCAKTSRIGKKVLEDGSKVRVCKKCGETIEPKA
jgi:large subunit ribosomal protein L24